MPLSIRRQRMAPLEQRTVPAKVCKRCGLTKSASEFYRNKLMSDGLYSHCKVSLRAVTCLWHPLPCQLHLSKATALLGADTCVKQCQGSLTLNRELILQDDH